MVVFGEEGLGHWVKEWEEAKVLEWWVGWLDTLRLEVGGFEDLVRLDLD